MRKRRLHIMLVYCVVVVMVMIFIQSYSPTDIEVTHSAIAYPLDDKASAVITSISVHGKYYQQWFRKKRFEGQITVAGWPYIWCGYVGAGGGYTPDYVGYCEE